jgi:DHA1 family bicyclomycin/chloramphenicol resistance-like MFS transporter
VFPLSLGYLCLGAGCLLVVLWTERGRLFVPTQPQAAPEEQPLSRAAE